MTEPCPTKSDDNARRAELEKVILGALMELDDGDGFDNRWAASTPALNASTARATTPTNSKRTIELDDAIELDDVLTKKAKRVELQDDSDYVRAFSALAASRLPPLADSRRPLTCIPLPTTLRR